MTAEILVNVAPGESRVALVEDGSLRELHLQRDSQRGVVGNIYLGRVQRVLPGMQAAFVEIGLQRTAFLHANDIVTKERDLEPGERPGISQSLTEHQSVLVQVIKDPLGSKGARLTTYISLPSRHLVLMPYSRHNAISARIEDPDERRRLLGLIDTLHPETGTSGGFIARTVAEGVDKTALAADMRFLERLWYSILMAAAEAAPVSLLHGDLPLVTRMLRDLLGPDIVRVRIDSPEALKKVLDFAGFYVPELANRIELYDGDAPIFDLYGIDDDIDRALQPAVRLKSGGSVVIEQTEAMTTVDVNTGGFVGTHDVEDTIVRTNLEAVEVLVRQIRLRNLGGIIIIDFIDMASEAHRNLVLQSLENALARDPAKTTISQISPLGLVEMTRKRNRESLEHVLCEVCPACGGRGSVKSLESVCHEIFRDLLRSARHASSAQLMVLAHPDVVAALLDEHAEALADISTAIDEPIRLQAEALYQQENFDIVTL